jgi:hypothetical protein
MQSITIKTRSAYGNQFYDPMCESAKIFAAMTGKKTLTEETLKYIALLGYAVNVQSGDIPDWLKLLEISGGR